MRGNRACILSCGSNRTVHNDVLECTGELRNEGSIAVIDIHDDGELMTITIEVTVNPVAGIEDVLILFCCVLDVVCHLHINLEAIADTVPAFCQINVGSGLQEVSIILRTELKTLEVEATTSRADTILVERMCSSLSCSTVRESEVALALAVTVGRTRCIDLTAAECCGNGERINANCLNPVNLALVGVQLIANATVCEIVVCHNTCGSVVTPLVGDIVVRGSTIGTVCIDVLIVGFQINTSHIATITGNVGTAIIGNVQVAAVGDDEVVGGINRMVAPTYETTAILSGCAENLELNQIVLQNSTATGNCDEAAVCGIACEGAVHSKIDVATADNTVAPYCDT